MTGDHRRAAAAEEAGFTRRRSELTETFCKVESGDGKVGYGLVEMVFMGRNARYGFEGY
ncbi:hypothetical protein [Nocardia gipuzkoensis]